MKRTTIFLCILGLISFTRVEAQEKEVLYLEDAISLALEQNQTLQIQQRNVEIAENEVYLGNAGLLPTLSFQGNASYQNNNSDVLIRTFQENPPTLALSDGSLATTTYSATVQADYALLGGFQGKYRFKLLQDKKDLAYYQQQVVINQTIVAVSDVFLEIVRLERQEELLLRNVKIGEERLQKTQDQFEFGKVTGLDVLRAKTDLNQDRSMLSGVLVTKRNLSEDLNFLIGLDAESQYTAASTYKAPINLARTTLQQEVLSGNPEILLSKKGVDLTANQYKLTTAQRLPVINAFANYGYFNQTTDLQQLAEIESLGYTVGIGIRYNLFNGGKTNRNIQTVKLNQEISAIAQQETQTRILTQALKEQNNLILLREQLNREEENINTFRDSYTRTEERFYNGKVSSLDLRNAQLALLNAEIIIGNLRTDVMKASLRLEALKGNLMK